MGISPTFWTSKLKVSHLKNHNLTMFNLLMKIWNSTALMILEMQKNVGGKNFKICRLTLRRNTKDSKNINSILKRLTKSCKDKYSKKEMSARLKIIILMIYKVSWKSLETQMNYLKMNLNHTKLTCHRC